MAVADMVAGLLIGGALGIVNVLVLRAGVFFAVKCGRRGRATLVIAGSYAMRYILIAIVIYVVMQKGSLIMAVVTLGVLGVMTILSALIQSRKSAGGTGS